MTKHDRNQYLSDVAGANLYRETLAKTNAAEIDRMKSSLPYAIDRLSNRQKQLVQMHYIEGMSQRRIAKELGVNEGTVSHTLARARKNLEKMMFLLLMQTDGDTDN